jgi:kinesin family protein C1
LCPLVFVRVRPVISEDLISANSINDRGAKRKQPHEHDIISDIPFSFPDFFERDQQSNSFSKVNSPFCEDDITKQAIVAIEPYKDRGGLKNRQKKWKFGFDHVFSPNHKQVDVWNASEPLVQSVIDGYNVCIFAYGQTGSGKTYTMIGGSVNDKKGIVFRAVEKIFQAKKDLEASQSSISVKLSVELLEIYNENIRDLLALNNRQDTLRMVSSDVVGNVCATVEKEEDVYEILSFASSKRCVKATNSNVESSRSHMLFTIHFVAYRSDNIMRVGKLHICDLAGSERLDKSGCHMISDGSLLKETQNINKSLMCLSTVIEKLQVNDSHIPFRDSKLTMLLQNSLGGDSKTLAIVCCNPLPEHFHESMSSIRFASKVSRVELKAMAKVSY